MSKFLDLEGVEKVFPLPKGEEYVAVRDVNLNIRENEFLQFEADCPHEYRCVSREMVSTIMQISYLL